MRRWTAIVIIIALLVVGGPSIYYIYSYLSSRPIEISRGKCMLPAIYREQPQKDVELVLTNAELKFATKSGPVQLPNTNATELMLVAEYMSCKYEERNPSLTEDQRVCYRAFILSSAQPQQATTYERCIERNVFSRHVGDLRSLANLFARTPNAKIALDLDDKAGNFRTTEIQAPDDPKLVQKICEIYSARLSCSANNNVVSIRVKS